MYITIVLKDYFCPIKMRINGLNDICYDKGRDTYNFHNENKRVTIKSENILYFITYLEDKDE